MQGVRQNINEALQTHDESAAEKIVQVGICGWKTPDGQEMQDSIEKAIPAKQRWRS